jgi:hypothetical protein
MSMFVDRDKVSSLVLFLAAALLLVPAATAGVYKCLNDNGTFMYQEDPCKPGKELRNFDDDPPTLSVIPGIPTPPARPAESRTHSTSEPKAAKAAASEHSDRNLGRVTGPAQERKFIRSGMTEAEVVARVGRPDITAGGGRNKHSRWSYLPHPDDPDTITTITFDGDRVSDVTRRLVKR